MARTKSNLSELILLKAKEILEEEHPITLRRLHYLLCSSDIKELYPNTQAMYKRLTVLTTEARKRGELSYEFFDDPTRAVHTHEGWSGIEEKIRVAVDYYSRDHWQDQPFRVECWIEKDGIINPLRETVRSWQITLRSMHGQASSSCSYAAAKTFAQYPANMPIYILYYGDQDPCGEEIPESALERVKEILTNVFHAERKITLIRLGFNPSDFDAYGIESIEPKTKDSLLKKYLEKYGPNARFAEVDSLPKDVLTGRINGTMEKLLDVYHSREAWEASIAKEEEEKLVVIEALRDKGLYNELQ